MTREEEIKKQAETFSYVFNSKSIFTFIKS